MRTRNKTAPKTLQTREDAKKIDKKTKKSKVVRNTILKCFTINITKLNTSKVSNRKNDGDMKIQRTIPRNVPELNIPKSNKKNIENNSDSAGTETQPRTRKTTRLRINLTRLDVEQNNEKEKEKKNENDGKTDSDTDSPKRKKLKKHTVKVTNLGVTGNKTDPTMSFGNFTIDNSSLKPPIAESTAVRNGILTGE